MTKSSNIYIPNNEVEKTFIKCIWRLSEYDIQERKEIILPKGTVEIIFNFFYKINYFSPSYKIEKSLPDVFVNGINFKPFELTKTKQQKFLGVQLNSIGLRLLFKIPSFELNNIVCDGNDICKQLSNLANDLNGEEEFSQQVKIILSWIRNTVSFNQIKYATSRAEKLTSCICYNNLTVKKLSKEIGLSERQLSRFSNDWLGMSTEQFIHYRKYLNCLNLLHQSKQNLTALGMQAGYYDQSHFIHQFKSFTDMTPRQYREAKTDLPGHIY